MKFVTKKGGLLFSGYYTCFFWKVNFGLEKKPLFPYWGFNWLISWNFIKIYKIGNFSENPGLLPYLKIPKNSKNSLKIVKKGYKIVFFRILRYGKSPGFFENIMFYNINIKTRILKKIRDFCRTLKTRKVTKNHQKIIKKLKKINVFGFSRYGKSPGFCRQDSIF